MMEVIALVALAVALLNVIVQYRAWKHPIKPKPDETKLDPSVQNNPVINVNIDVYNDRNPYDELDVPPSYTVEEERKKHREQPAKKSPVS